MRSRYAGRTRAGRPPRQARGSVRRSGQRVLLVCRVEAAAGRAFGQGRHRGEPGDAGGLRVPSHALAGRGGYAGQGRRRKVDQDSLMSIVLCRIDDRLIHGQVVIGWGRPLGINLIILVDDQVAASDWEQELYRMAVDPNIEVRFVSVADATAHLREWQENGKRG